MKPPISRMGGKSKLRKIITEKIPKDHICYVEPFFGAGWVYFAKEESKVEVINDKDRELINLFRMIKEHPGEVERLLDFEFISRDKFREYKAVDLENLTEIQRAVRFLYIISNSFASRGVSFGYTAMGKPCQKIYDVQNELMLLRDRLKNTIVENKDAIEIIKKYDRPTTFYFCDPPYLGTSGYGAEAKFTLEDHIRLRDTLSNISGKFLLTINDCEEIRKLYKDFHIQEVMVHYSVSRQQAARKEYGELMITNYEN